MTEHPAQGHGAEASLDGHTLSMLLLRAQDILLLMYICFSKILHVHKITTWQIWVPYILIVCYVVHKILDGRLELLLAPSPAANFSG